MQVDIKYFYTGGTEIKQHDLVFLEGFEEDKNANFSGFCRIAFINGDKLTVYPLGHTWRKTYTTTEMYLEHIETLVKVDSQEIDIVLEKAIKRLGFEIGE